MKAKLLFVSILGALTSFAGQAVAGGVLVLPEPSILSILGIAAVAGIVVWRIKRKK